MNLQTNKPQGHVPSMIEWAVRDNGQVMISVANPDRTLLDAKLFHENREVELRFADGVEIAPYGGGSPSKALLVRLCIESQNKLLLLGFCQAKEAVKKILPLKRQPEPVGA